MIPDSQVVTAWVNEVEAALYIFEAYATVMHGLPRREGRGAVGNLKFKHICLGMQANFDPVIAVIVFRNVFESIFNKSH